MEYRIPKKGDVYRHFKGNLYEVIIIARDSETLEEKVVYKAVDGDDAYVRPLTMFLSKVDHEKYPDVMQEFRFELLSEKKEEVLKAESVETSEPVQEEPVIENGSMIMEFLDLDSTNDKIQYLLQNKDQVTDSFLGFVAQSLDFVENTGSVNERLEDIIKYLRTVSRYENTRFR